MTQLFHYENFLLNQNGTPIPGVTVWVCQGNITPLFTATPPGPLASIFSDVNGISPIIQPFTTSPLGNYSFYVLSGQYTVVFEGQGLQSSDLVTVPGFPGVNLSGTTNFTGVLTAGNINNILTVDGIQYTTLFSAFSALPAAGGTIDMRGNSNAAALNLSTGFTSGIIDVGTQSVTILLGPYTYTATQFVLRSNLHILGTGVGQGLGGTTKPPTIIQSVGSNATALFVLAQVVGEGQEDIILSGFRCQGAAANTSQSCFSLIPANNGGLWYSEFSDLLIGGFKGIVMDFESANNGTNQFSTFRRIVISRVNGGSYALQVKGFANCLRFENCQFDGAPFGVLGGDGLVNINIQDAVGASFVPYDIQFDLVTTQWAGVGFQINGCDSLEINQGHFEGCSGAIKLGDGSVNHSMGVMLSNCWFGNGTGVNSGNGYIINQTTANTQLSVLNTHVFGIPDTLFKGTVVNTPQFGIFESTNQVPLPPAFGSPSGFGTGSAGTAVTTTTKGAGSGPTTPQTIVNYQQIQINGTVYWIPLVQ